MNAQIHFSRWQILKLKMFIIAAKVILLVILIYGAKQYYFSEPVMPAQIQYTGSNEERTIGLYRTTERTLIINMTCGINRICAPYQLCNRTVTEKDPNVVESGFFVDYEDTHEYCGYLNQCCHKDDVITLQSNEIKHKPLTYENCSFTADYQRRQLDARKNHTNLEQFSLPWVVNIVQRLNYQKSKLTFVCGGSLITPKVVLTAASCFDTALDIFGEIFVRAGEFSDNLKPIWMQERRIHEKIKHEKYHLALSQDNILLLIVDEPFQLNNNVQPVCLPPSHISNLDYSYCFIAGFPRGDYDVAHIYRIADYKLSMRRRITLHVLDEEQHCSFNFMHAFTHDSDTKKLKPNLICLGKDNKDDKTCHADAGSAIVCSLRGTLDFYQVAMSRKNFYCDGFDMPNMETDVAYFRPWIEEKLKERNIVLT